VRIGVEVGGTFTDLVLVRGGRISIEKVPSTPAAPENGALAAIDATGAALAEVSDLVHGSTVATNAILERKGAHVALFVTAGFRDLLQLQRHSRSNIYDLFYRKPEPVVQRRDTFEIHERVNADGSIAQPLDEAAARATIARALDGHDYAAVAVCLLNSFVNPLHEERLLALLREHAPDLPVSCSIHVNREFREYERCSTTALAAYVQPVIDGYLRRFDAELGERGYAGRFSIMQSNGGRLPAAAMADNAITSLFSGPAAGVIGATRQAARSGYADLITLDMGGTSTDVCLIEAGRPQLTGETFIDGLPIKTPVIDIATVGAGGGSLVWVDDGDLLRVGPSSAGATPGPACYARGGSDPTITDAHVIRGTIRPESFLRGAMALDAQAAHAAFVPLARRLGISVRDAADSAVRVAEANIVRAVQRISTERGKDPRDYVLVPFGGAGPMQALRVADELGIDTVVVPPHAGVLSALGLVVADFVHFETRTHRLRVGAETMAEFVQVLDALETSVRAYLATLDLVDEVALSLTLQMRYAHQAFEIPVDLDPLLARDIDATALRERFDAAHRGIFGFAADHPCDIVSFRVGGAVPPDEVLTTDPARAAAEPPRQVSIYDQGSTQACLCQARDGIHTAVAGPFLIEDGTSTIFLAPGWSAHPDEHGNLIMRKHGEPA
jgi:N-methylhydantoinase A